MFGKIKKILGIEDVKIELVIPEEVFERFGSFEGVVKVSSFKDSRVESITIKMVEKYSRGRKKEKLIDEYKVGEIFLDKAFDIKKDDILEIPFDLPFNLLKSDIDQFGDRNFVFGGMASIAKVIRGAKSTFYIEAEAKVVGTALHPVSKADVNMK